MQRSGTLLIQLRNTEYHDRIGASCHKPVNGQFVELTMRSNGGAIDADHLQRLLEPLYSGNLDDESRGVGAIHGIMHHNDGHILVDNDGMSTAFSLIFKPLGRGGKGIPHTEEGQHEHTDGVATESHSATNIALLPSFSSTGQLLLIDDNVRRLGELSALLEQHGFAVDAHMSAGLAWEHLWRNPDNYALVIARQSMPGLTGAEIAKQVATLRPALPVLIAGEETMPNNIPFNNIPSGNIAFDNEADDGANITYVDTGHVNYARLLTQIQALLGRNDVPKPDDSVVSVI
jgi:CheY-like chemotaxis protein